MSFRIFDTYQRQKIVFESIEENKALLYHCGPTVYNYAHIGNYRAYILSDLIRRWLEVNGYEVRQIMNITDVDDKTIKKAVADQVPLNSITDYYRDAFFEDIDRLHIQRAHVYPAATDHINEMVDIIKSLIEKGHAYKTDDGSVYFRVQSYSEYGNLSGKKLEDLRVGERVTSDEYESKDDVRDFALWKAWDERDGDVFWETDIGKGRPGWHIECSAMSMKHLGKNFDIHTGGADNIFPHHENEIAQSKCATGEGFSKYWMHCDYLVVEGKKMSKSLGNFFTLRDLIEKGYTARSLRYILIGTHYRSRLNFTENGLNAAISAIKRLDEFRGSWQEFPVGESNIEFVNLLNETDDKFNEAMNDDLNVSNAMAAVFNFVRIANSMHAHGDLFSEDVKALEAIWQKWDKALGIFVPFSEELKDNSEIDSTWIEDQITLRNQARKDKNWAEADRIRDELADAGILIKDGPDGTNWKKM